MQPRLVSSLLLPVIRLTVVCAALTLSVLFLRRSIAASSAKPAMTTTVCRASDVAAGPLRRWPRRVAQFSEPYAPATLHLASLLYRHGRRLSRPPAPPHPVRTEFPVPALPSAAESVRLLILVKSAPANGEARRAVRDTWGGVRHWPAGSLTRFIVGSPAAPELLAEAAEFGDVIVHGEGDGYRNNTRKLLAGLAWAARYLPQLRLLHLVDDDLLVNPFAARPLLTEAAAAVAPDLLLAGHLVHGARPVRPGHGTAGNRKWTLTTAEYPNRSFPDYLSAAWVLFSAGLLPDLLWAAGHVTPRLPFDDVYLGLLAAKLNLRLTNLGPSLLDLDRGPAGASGDSPTSLPRPPLEHLLARHGYSRDSAGGDRLRRDWQGLVRLHCGSADPLVT